jgi:hypothetical protein
MQKQMAVSLTRKAAEVAATFSLQRGGNVLNETFSVLKIEVLSELTAVVTFHKEPTLKQAVAWFYYINSRAKPRWEYFFVTYSHLVGLGRVSRVLNEVEQNNFKLSIREDPA